MKRLVVITSVLALALVGCQQYGDKGKATGDAAATNGAARNEANIDAQDAD